jgi:hypothetical protein
MEARTSTLAPIPASAGVGCRGPEKTFISQPGLRFHRSNFGPPGLHGPSRGASLVPECLLLQGGDQGYKAV